MSSTMSLVMTPKRYKKLFTDDQIETERLFEIRIRDLRQRNGVKQVSFSLEAKRGLKNEEYLSAEEIKKLLKDSLKKEMEKYE